MQSGGESVCFVPAHSIYFRVLPSVPVGPIAYAIISAADLSSFSLFAKDTDANVFALFPLVLLYLADNDQGWIPEKPVHVRHLTYSNQLLYRSIHRLRRP